MPHQQGEEGKTLEQLTGSKQKVPPGAHSGEGRAGDLACGRTGRPPRAEDDGTYYLRPQDPLSYRRFAESVQKAADAATRAHTAAAGPGQAAARGVGDGRESREAAEVQNLRS